MLYLVCCTSGIFLSTPSARRATGAEVGTDAARTISIHALREEGDANRQGLFASTMQFLSTPSARRATKRDFKTRYEV